MGGAEMNHMAGYPPLTKKHGGDQVTVSNEHIKRGNPNIKSYTHHNPAGIEPPLPVSHKLHPLATPTFIIGGFLKKKFLCSFL